MKFNYVFIFLLTISLNSIAQSGRTEVDLSNINWKLSLDTAAKWHNDKLYAPPVDVKSLPVNRPAGGWDALIGLRLFSGEPVVACVSDHKKEVYSALSIVRHGRGKIILCSLDIFACLKDVAIAKQAEGEGENAAMNTFNASQKNRANVVGQQLLLNILKLAARE